MRRRSTNTGPAISNATSATTANAARLRLPCGMSLWGVSGVVRTLAGTTPTCAIDVKAGAASLLTAPLAVTAAAPADAAIKTGSGRRIADEAVLAIDVTLGGDDPVATDIDVLLTLVRTA